MSTISRLAADCVASGRLTAVNYFTFVFDRQIQSRVIFVNSKQTTESICFQKHRKYENHQLTAPTPSLDVSQLVERIKIHH